MSVPSSVEELLQLIRKSGMIEDQKFDAYLQRRQAGRGLPPDPRDAADAMVKDGLITGFQAEQFLLGKWRGFTIGKYKLLERVGVGGMGQVFLCEHMYMKRRVAIKVLPPAKAEQPAALGRFYREARAAGSLEHPNIVRTHDIDQDGNLHFIVMEYVDGSNMLDMVKKFGAMDIRRATYYVRQVALGLDFAFRSGIIHRDIKPGNILIDRAGNAKILDMGLARFYKDQTDMLTVKYDDKIVLGTADYVAPEQVANSHSVDVRADIYALGASFYFLLAGHPAFPTGTVSQKLLWHRTKDPTPIRQIRPEIPEGIANIVAKMMAKDPNVRYQTPAEVAADLVRWVPGEIPPPSHDEMPQLSPAALDGSQPEFEPSHGAGETVRAQETEADTPSRYPAEAPASVFMNQRANSAGSQLAPAHAAAVATAPTSASPFRAPATKPTRRQEGFPPSPFAPKTQPANQMLPSTQAPNSRGQVEEEYAPLQHANAEPSLMKKAFGDTPNTKFIAFVVLSTMCFTLGLGLVAMKLMKPAPAPTVPVAETK
ncbi:MAG: serine/threonine protein kinase [Fimbriiglobus sp.]